MILEVALVVNANVHGTTLPMYRVSPQLLVTREHIMSDSSSTSGLSLSFVASGDVSVGCGVGSLSVLGVLFGDAN